MAFHPINYFGISLAVIGLAWLISSLRFSLRAVHVKGKVIENVERPDVEGTTFAAKYTYQDGAGILHTGMQRCAWNPAWYRPGQEIKVIYKSESPSISKIMNIWTLYIMPTFMLGAGLLFTLIR